MSHTYTVRRDEVTKKSWHVCEISCPDCASRTHIWAFETAITLVCPCQRLLSLQQPLCCCEQSSWSQARGEGGCRLSAGNVWNVPQDFKVIFVILGRWELRERCFIPFCLKTYNKEQCTVVWDPWNPGLLSDFGQDPEQSQLPLHRKDVLASFMEHSRSPDEKRCCYDLPLAFESMCHGWVMSSTQQALIQVDKYVVSVAAWIK